MFIHHNLSTHFLYELWTEDENKPWKFFFVIDYPLNQSTVKSSISLLASLSMASSTFNYSLPFSMSFIKCNAALSKEFLTCLQSGAHVFMSVLILAASPNTPIHIPVKCIFLETSLFCLHFEVILYGIFMNTVDMDICYKKFPPSLWCMLMHCEALWYCSI